MYRFQHPSYFWLLWLIPILVFSYLYFLAWRKRNLKKIGHPSFVRALIKGKINGRLTTKVVLTSLAILCLVTALANLQAGGHPEKVERKGLDVVFALDVSNSMLARDASPNRLSKAKGLIFRMLEQLRNDRTGLVVFAGNAYLQVPLTVDYGAMKMLLSSVNPGMIPTQGTNFSEAILLANKSFRKEDKKNKVVILISDGEDHDESAIETAKKVSRDGVIIYTVGIGSPRGSTIYDPSTGQPKVDRNGNVVITKLNEGELRRIAEATGGRYQFLQNSGSIANNLSQSIQQLGTKNLGAVIYTDYKSYFQYFLGAGLLLFLIAWLLPDAKRREQTRAGSTIAPQNATPVLIVGLAFFCFVIAPQRANAQKETTAKEQKPSLSFRKNINQGNEAFRQHKYDSAQAIYQSALQNNPSSFEGHFNLGDALYASGKYGSARKSLENSLKTTEDKKSRAAALHNIGNSYMQEKNWKEAAEAFKQSLLLNPADRDTKYNLAYAQKMLQQQQQNQKNDKNNKDKNNKDKKDQKNKNNKNNKDNKDQQQKDKNDENNQQNQDKNQEKKQQPKEGGNKDKKQQENPNRQMQPSKLSKQQADNILNALNQEEKELHKKKKKATGVPAQPEKDW